LRGSTSLCSLKSSGGNDYEVLALGPCSGDAGAPTCIFVGEIGNNAARDAAGLSGRVVSNIYRIVEPVLPSSIDVKSPVMRSVPADVISFNFSQSGIVTADCEALVVWIQTVALILVAVVNSGIEAAGATNSQSSLLGSSSRSRSRRRRRGCHRRLRGNKELLNVLGHCSSGPSDYTCPRRLHPPSALPMPGSSVPSTSKRRAGGLGSLDSLLSSYLYEVALACSYYVSSTPFLSQAPE
jgi:hypothetical protein